VSFDFVVPVNVCVCVCVCARARWYDTCHGEGSPNLNMTLKHRSGLNSGGHMRIRTDQSLSVMSFKGTRRRTNQISW